MKTLSIAVAALSTSLFLLACATTPSPAPAASTSAATATAVAAPPFAAICGARHVDASSKIFPARDPSGKVTRYAVTPSKRIADLGNLIFDESGKLLGNDTGGEFPWDNKQAAETERARVAALFAGAAVAKDETALSCPSSLIGAVASGAPVVASPPPSSKPTTPAAGHGWLDASFRGECAPAGSRGGCYSLTLKADGTFREVLLDATQGGNYSIEGSSLMLVYPRGGPPAKTLTSSDGFQSLSNGYKRVASL